MKPKFTPSVKRQITVIAVVLIAMAALTALFFPLFRSLADPEGRERFESLVGSLGIWGILLVYAIQLLQIVVALIPGEPVEIIAGAMYGTVGGLLICEAGIITGSLLIFAIVRKFGVRILNWFFTPEQIAKQSFLNDGVKLETVTFLLFLIPGTPKDLLTYFAGLTKIKMWKFIAISGFARIPSVISSTLVGSALGDGRVLFSVILFAATAVIGLIGIRIDAAYRKHLAKKKK